LQLWDLAAGKSMTTLTQHKKAVRSLAANPRVSDKLPLI
jgi:pleiotropic regulator 1